MDVVVWQRSLGLDEYEKVFRENKVDAAVLPKLTADDLKDLGVRPSGSAASHLRQSKVYAPAKGPISDLPRRSFVSLGLLMRKLRHWTGKSRRTKVEGFYTCSPGAMTQVETLAKYAARASFADLSAQSRKWRF
jgi:hypothetical protein